MKGLRTTVYLVALLASAGCTSMQEVRLREDRSLADYLELGDRLVVYEMTGRVIDMRYVRTDGRSLIGSLTDDGLTAVRVDFDAIERIEAERIALARTAGAVVGGIVLAPIAAVGAGMALAEYQKWP